MTDKASRARQRFERIANTRNYTITDATYTPRFYAGEKSGDDGGWEVYAETNDGNIEIVVYGWNQTEVAQALEALPVYDGTAATAPKSSDVYPPTW